MTCLRSHGCKCQSGHSCLAPTRLHFLQILLMLGACRHAYLCRWTRALGVCDAYVWDRAPTLRNLSSSNNYSVLVCLGGCSKVQKTGWLINHRNACLTLLEAGSLRWGCRRRRRRPLFGFADFLLCPHVAEGARDDQSWRVADVPHMHPNSFLESENF